MKARLRIAVDTGGTFTDICLFDDQNGKLNITKVPSTPLDPAEAVIDGVKKLMIHLSVEPQQVRFFLHGTNRSHQCPT